MASSGGRWHVTRSGNRFYVRKGESVQRASRRQRRRG